MLKMSFSLILCSREVYSKHYCKISLSIRNYFRYRKMIHNNPCSIPMRYYLTAYFPKQSKRKEINILETN